MQAIDGAGTASVLAVAVKPAGALRPSASPESPKRAATTAAAIDLARVHEALDSINSVMRVMNRGLKFSVDADTKAVVVKVIDRETGEVVRQIPAEEALRIKHALHQLQGLLIGEKA